jgi:hypothetical protein
MAKRDDLGGTTTSPGQGTSGPVQEVKTQAKDLASQAKDQTVKMASQARDQVTQAVAERKDRTANRLGSLAGALHDVAHRLQEEEDDGLGRYAGRLAEQVDRLSTYLRDHDLRAFVRDSETFARRRPEIFLGGTFLAGLALARFLKSSAPEREYGGNQPWQQPSTGLRDTAFADRSEYAPERRNPDEAFATGTGTSTYNAPLGG